MYEVIGMIHIYSDMYVFVSGHISQYIIMIDWWTAQDRVSTTSLARVRIRYYKSCVLYLNVQWDSYDKFSIIPVPRYTRYKLHHGNGYTALTYRIPGCAPASRLIGGKWRGRTINKTDASEDQIPELQPSGLEADKDGRYVSACHLHSLFARLSHTQEPGKEATACNTNWIMFIDMQCTGHQVDCEQGW